MQSNSPLTIRTLDENLTLFPRPPLLTSVTMPWEKKLGLLYLRLPAFSIPKICFPFHCLTLFLTATSANMTLDGKAGQQSITPGNITIIPAHVEVSSSWMSTVEMVTIGLNPALFADAIGDATHPYSTEIVPQFATSDPLVQQLLLSLKAVIEQDRLGSGLYIETAAAMLSVHLFQHHSQRKLEYEDYTDGLPRTTLCQVIEYIHAHLHQELGLAELAAIAHLSPYYFSRLFKQSTGVTPHQFVISARVERAKTLLLAGKHSIAEIAQQVGFANQAHLNKHLKRLLGVTPGMISNSARIDKKIARM
jgi:AraC family transcriptional regulator